MKVQWQVKYTNESDLHVEVAKRIFSGEVLFLYRGASEFGPRALGNRSIIASPQSYQVIERLNNLKRREYFNPFAASCLKKDANLFFSDDTEAPFMTFAIKARDDAKQSFMDSVVHKDGTCRAQVFSRDFNPKYYDLIEEFRKLSGFGLVLNTSLNGPGEPIVESPDEAIRLFSETNISRTLLVEQYLVTKL